MKGDPFIIKEISEEVRDSHLSNFQENQESGNFFFLTGRATNYLKQNLATKKFLFLLSVSLFLLTGLLGRLVYLQIYRNQYFANLSEGNRLREQFITPARGIFFDNQGIPLVENIPAFSLYLNPPSIDKQQTAKILEILQPFRAEIEDQNYTLDNILASPSQVPILIKSNLPYEQAIKLLVLVHDLKGIEVRIDSLRKYLYDNAFAHVFGYTSLITDKDRSEYLAKGYQLTERIGRTGLESYYQDVLRGSPGWKSLEVNSRGQEQRVYTVKEQTPGSNLYLAIDGQLQKKIVDVLQEQVGQTKAGAVVAMDPRSGKIRALVSWPTFDSNKIGQNSEPGFYKSLLDNQIKPLFNRFLLGEYPSGSTIKIVISAAALAEKVIDENTTVISSGGIHYDKWFFPDWKAGGHGVTNVVKAIAESVNTFFYYLALPSLDSHRGLGLDLLLKYFKLFGLSQPSGIDLYGERSGFVPSREWKEATKHEAWYPGDTMHLAIGQGDLLVTPIQVAVYTAAIASGGKLWQPELVEKIVNPKDNSETIIEPKIRANLPISAEDFSIVQKGMRTTVLAGSARRLQSIPVPVAGKTGTAQSIPGKPNHAWFTGYLPADNPELVLTVLVEYGGEGSSIAVPIAEQVFSWYSKVRILKTATSTPN